MDAQQGAQAGPPKSGGPLAESLEGTMNLTDRCLGSPNHMVWEYYHSLKRQASRTSKCSGREQRQEAALTVILAVTVVEIFLNAYFRVVVSEKPFRNHEEKLLQDLTKRISLEKKCREWPLRIFGASPDSEISSIRAFAELRELRNKLIHFSSSHETVHLPENITIHGLADSSAYNSLTPQAACASVDTVRGYAYEIFRLHGIPQEKWPHSFHAWFGDVPSNQALKLTLLATSQTKEQ